VVSLFTTTTMIVPPQQVDNLSVYNPNASSPSHSEIVKPAPKATPTLPSTPNVYCAMDTIESLESFLSCLGAK
jgi:hypothetical protein